MISKHRCAAVRLNRKNPIRTNGSDFTNARFAEAIDCASILLGVGNFWRCEDEESSSYQARENIAKMAGVPSFLRCVHGPSIYSGGVTAMGSKLPIVQ